MTLIQTRPQARPALTAFDRFDDLFDQMWGTPVATRHQDYDLFETGDALVLELAVPGLGQDAITVTVEGRTLTLELGDSDASEASAEEDRRILVQGLNRPTGATRRFTLPEGMDADGTTARVKNGLLTVTVPKAQEARVRKVDVQAE